MKHFLYILLICLIGCTQGIEKSFDLQGHRGARGLVPENSIPAFILATGMGVNTLELDLVVSKDNKLVVSHEPFFSYVFCVDTLGNSIPEDSVINMYNLTYDQIRKFDCGSQGNDRFPEQKRLPTFKPLLEEVVDSVESFIRKSALPAIRYNIELKTTATTDNVYHPTPAEFSDLVYSFLKERNMIDRVIIQSFDFRTLKYFNSNYPEIELVLLIENDLPWRSNIDSLGFTPEVYSCYYELLSQELVQEIQDANMKVVPWTVNQSLDMKELIDWGVDGIITDYPDRALEIIN